MASRGNRHCATCIGTLSFPMHTALFRGRATTNLDNIHLIVKENYNQPFSNWSKKIERMQCIKFKKRELHTEYSIKQV